jgi:hypothetical protein
MKERVFIMTDVNVNIFEVATRNGFRFQFKGMISVEDLWDCSVRDLDSIFKTLNSQLKKVNEESLLQVKTQQDQELDIKIKIVKYIFGVKQEEENLRLKAKEQKEKKQKIMEILANKQDEGLQNKSVEELQNMLNELDS